MSDNHSHSHSHEDAPPSGQPTAGAVITRLNERLDEKATELRRVEDREVYWQARSDDLQNELTAMRAMIDQVWIENRILRSRLGLDEVGPLELTDQEAGDLPDGSVETQD